MTVRNTEQTAAWLRDQITNPSQSWDDLCLGLQRTARGLPGEYATAFLQYQHAQFKHALPNGATDFSLIPRGAPLFYKNYSEGAGHVVFYCGIGPMGPVCITNDAVTQGRVNRVSPLWFLQHWNQSLIGWTEDMEDTVFPLGAPHRANVSYEMILSQFSDPRPTFRSWVQYQIRLVQKAIGTPQTGRVTEADIEAYSNWQRQCGFRGQDANGIPGIYTLTKLGTIHHFLVTTP